MKKRLAKILHEHQVGIHVVCLVPEETTGVGRRERGRGHKGRFVDSPSARRFACGRFPALHVCQHARSSTPALPSGPFLASSGRHKQTPSGVTPQTPGETCSSPNTGRPGRPGEACSTNHPGTCLNQVESLAVRALQRFESSVPESPGSVSPPSCGIFQISSGPIGRIGSRSSCRRWRSSDGPHRKVRGPPGAACRRRTGTT